MRADALAAGSAVPAFEADHGLPIPLVNVPLLGFEVDFLWPNQKLVVEMDSSHHDSPRARAADAARDAELGWSKPLAIGRSLPSDGHERLTHAFQPSPSISDGGLPTGEQGVSVFPQPPARGRRGAPRDANCERAFGFLFVGESHTTRMGRPWRR